MLRKWKKDNYSMMGNVCLEEFPENSDTTHVLKTERNTTIIDMYPEALEYKVYSPNRQLIETFTIRKTGIAQVSVYRHDGKKQLYTLAIERTDGLTLSIPDLLLHEGNDVYAFIRRHVFEEKICKKQKKIVKKDKKPVSSHSNSQSNSSHSSQSNSSHSNSESLYPPLEKLREKPHLLDEPEYYFPSVPQTAPPPYAPALPQSLSNSLARQMSPAM